MKIKAAPCLAVAALLAGCSGASTLREAFDDPPAWERYASSLEEADLATTALGREWIAAGERALSQAPLVETPYREVGYLSPDRPSAVGYRMFLRRGHRLVIDVEMSATEPGRIFLDLFRTPSAGDSLAPPEQVAAADADSTRLEVEVARDGEYVLRVQPELLRGGRYEISVRKGPMLAFPVEGAEDRHVASGWGDPRDGGARSHEGVDIFAPRGTPALAVAGGRVRRAGTNRLGGNTVWLSDGDGERSYYYAHLDRQAVGRGDQVTAGDTVGWVGNSGNAATTPPHLHFGVRLRGGGWVDAYPYIARADEEPAPPGVETARLGGWVRMRSDANLRRGPGVDTEAERTLPAHTVARALAGTADWYRVELPDRTVGFVWAPLVEELGAGVGTLAAADARPVREAPSVAAPPLDSLGVDDAARVLGRFGDWSLVRVDSLDGWVLAGE